MDMTDVLKLVGKTVEEIGWTKNTHMKLSKIHKKEAQTLLDIKTMLEKLRGFIEQNRAKVLKLAKPQYRCYENVQQHFEDTPCTISNLQRDIKTLRAEAVIKEEILRERAKAMNNGMATADVVVVAKAKHGICQAEKEFLDKEEALRNKRGKSKKNGKRRLVPKPGPDVLKEKYIKCHEGADMHFRSTLRSAEASLNAAKKISRDSKRTGQFKATNTQAVKTEVRSETKYTATDNSALHEEHSVERDDCTSLQMTALDPVEPFGLVKADIFDSHWSFEFPNVERRATQVSEGCPEDLLCLTESEIDLPEVDLLAQGDFSRCLATSFSNNHPRHKDRELTQKGHAVDVLMILPGVVEYS